MQFLHCSTAGQSIDRSMKKDRETAILFSSNCFEIVHSIIMHYCTNALAYLLFFTPIEVGHTNNTQTRQMNLIDLCALIR